MAHINIEIKAKSKNNDAIRDILKSKNAEFKGTDRQIDTYFRVDSGRLKLREGNIENALIYYEREEKKGPRQSNVILAKTLPGSGIKEIFQKVLGVLAVVDKKREIYFIENVKFHLDEVKGLGTFVEIEAMDQKGNIGRERLLKQCNEYLELFGIKQEDLVSESYSDMLMKK